MFTKTKFTLPSVSRSPFDSPVGCVRDFPAVIGACEVRARQYWRLDNLKSFDEFLEKRFADSRRKAYYLMAIHEKLTRIPKHELQLVGWSKATELVKVARKDGEGFDCATWLHKAKELPKEGFKYVVEQHLTGKET
jgi:hypothetical protein